MLGLLADLHHVFLELAKIMMPACKWLHVTFNTVLFNGGAVTVHKCVN